MVVASGGERRLQGLSGIEIALSASRLVMDLAMALMRSAPRRFWMEWSASCVQSSTRRRT